MAIALVLRGGARWWLGRPGWREDLEDAVAMARGSEPVTHALVVAYKCGPAIINGVLLADDVNLREVEEALRTAEGLGEDNAVALAQYTMALTLTHRNNATEREHGLEFIAQVRESAFITSSRCPK